jgi:hypothetical protein
MTILSLSEEHRCRADESPLNKVANSGWRTNFSRRSMQRKLR